MGVDANGRDTKYPDAGPDAGGTVEETLFLDPLTDPVVETPVGPVVETPTGPVVKTLVDPVTETQVVETTVVETPIVGA
jgi:hypothetical protein